MKDWSRHCEIRRKDITNDRSGGDDMEKCAVVIPIYRDTIELLEKLSLENNIEELKNFHIYVIMPKNLTPDFLHDYPDLRIVRFDDHLFRGYQGYNKLMLSEEFYQSFEDYEKILICQLDAYVFEDKLEYLSEESAILNFSAVLIRTSTERPEVLDKGTIIMGGIAEKNMLQAVQLAVSVRENCEHMNSVPDYVDENVSMKVVKIIQSYTAVVNETIWRKRQSVI